MKRLAVIIAALAFGLLAGLVWLGGFKKAQSGELKSAHFESSTPTQGQTLAGVPTNVVIDFNFDLSAGSEISVESDGREYATGETNIDSNKLAMRRAIDPEAPDGTYQVKYQACWPDGSCHDGRFSFSIDRSKASTFGDMRGQSEVVIKMSQVKFMPMELRINGGTKVTWVNDDEEEHYINTDAHPAHTYEPAQNSQALKKGDQYSYTFEEPGIYPYHCSAHAANMVGAILVD